MNTILIIIGLLAIAAGVGYVLIKKGKIKDSDGDFIPDVVEDKVDEIEAKVQKKVKELAQGEMSQLTGGLKIPGLFT